MAAPEMSLGLAAQAEVAQSFGLPTWGLAGATDAKVLDAQAGSEAAFSILAQGLAGLNLIHDVGYMCNGMVCSTAQLILGDENIDFVDITFASLSALWAQPDEFGNGSGFVDHIYLTGEEVSGGLFYAIDHTYHAGATTCDPSAPQP